MEPNNIEREQVVRLKQEGMSIASISFVVGVSRRQVTKIVAANVKRVAKANGPQALLSTAQTARVLNLHMNTIRRWSDTGKLTSYRIGSRGDRRFKWKDIKRVLRNGTEEDARAATRRFAELKTGVTAGNE